ncbi:hypothetical protein LS482_17340 [Sinomicrobium kalidii]|uniref:DUF6876 family protein n=1 Tax=Sinomicrobium kalidii TaxID=2900738 RepID=UPI001E3E88A3|nr:DUF6876 family protein [Sinomicrobium kalidii]UGU15434.1 hypothetical protein LS482_17340 [Sinomicrobium kalidii]
MINKANKIKENLRQFIGSPVFYSLSLLNTKFTEGIKYLIEEAQCLWLVIDVSAICKSPINTDYFVCINLKKLSKKEQKEKGYAALITYDDGNGNVFYEAHYNYTDFPLDEIRLYFVNDTLMLPSEY